MAEALQGLFTGSGPGNRGPEEPDNRRTLGAAEAGIAPVDDIRGDPSLAVGRSGERDEAPLPGDPVLHFDRVADREDIRIAGAHLIVHPDPATFADLQPGRFRQRGLRAHADGEDHQIRRIGFAGLRFDIDPAAVNLLESGHAVAKREADAMPLKVGLHRAGVLLVNRGQDLVGHLDQGDFEPALPRGFPPFPGR